MIIFVFKYERPIVQWSLFPDCVTKHHTSCRPSNVKSEERIFSIYGFIFTTKGRIFSIFSIYGFIVIIKSQYSQLMASFSPSILITTTKNHTSSVRSNAMLRVGNILDPWLHFHHQHRLRYQSNDQHCVRYPSHHHHSRKLSITTVKHHWFQTLQCWKWKIFQSLVWFLNVLIKHSLRY